jgi:hypothetical protein
MNWNQHTTTPEADGRLSGDGAVAKHLIMTENRALGEAGGQMATKNAASRREAAFSYS